MTIINSIRSADANVLVTQSTGYMPESGSLHWNGSTQRVELHTLDGRVMPMPQSEASIFMGGMFNTMESWVIRAMAKEAALENLCKQYPAIKDLNEKLEVLIALVQRNANENGA